MKFSLQLVSERWKKKSIARCRMHVIPLQSRAATCYALKKSMQSLQKVEQSSTFSEALN